MTAVEWLLENIGLKDNVLWKEVIEQAKEMEKEQIIDAYDNASSMICLQCSDCKIGEQYYNETFKSE